MPRKALEQYHLVLKKCPAQRQQMRDVLVYPDKGGLRAEEQAFVDLLHKQAAQTVKRAAAGKEAAKVLAPESTKIEKCGKETKPKDR